MPTNCGGMALWPSPWLRLFRWLECAEREKASRRHCKRIFATDGLCSSQFVVVFRSRSAFRCQTFAKRCQTFAKRSQCLLRPVYIKRKMLHETAKVVKEFLTGLGQRKQLKRCDLCQEKTRSHRMTANNFRSWCERVCVALTGLIPGRVDIREAL